MMSLLGRQLFRAGRMAGAILFAVSILPLHAQQPKGTPQGGGQLPQTGTPPDLRDQKAPNFGPPPMHTPTFQELQYVRYLESRLNSMVSDADKLLKLAQDLNRDNDSRHAGTTSANDVQKVAEIEKLAHSVKWKMRLVADATQGH